MLDFFYSDTFKCKKDVFKKYFKLIIWPSLLQSVFGDIIAAVVMLLFLKTIWWWIFIVMWFCFLVAHVLFRCFFGEDAEYDYKRDL